MVLIRRKVISSQVATIAALALVLSLHGLYSEGQMPTAAGSPARQIGTVQAITDNTITLTTDSGTAIHIVVQVSTRLLQIAPEQKDLNAAVPILLQEVHAGDRILARGNYSADGQTILASSIILMKQSDIAQKQQQERADWREHGVGGLVGAVDANSRTITVSTGTGTNKTIAVLASQNTTIRRYAPGSIRFEDAKPGTFDQIKVGDQLQARGPLNVDRTEMKAQEIVSGTFRNIAGTISRVEVGTSSISVLDLSSKKVVLVKVGSDSQLRNLPRALAERVAARLKRPPAQMAAVAESASRFGSGSAGQSDLQQTLQRLPTTALADLNKGDAVMIVATPGADSKPSTVITLLNGVEPILTASPSNDSSVLSTWNLASSIGDSTAQ